MATLQHYNTYIITGIYSEYLIGPPESSILGILTVMVFADALELIWFKTPRVSNDGARNTINVIKI